MSKIISVDVENTGLDHFHGARPYFVTSSDGDIVRFWEWPVCPLTRGVVAPADDLLEIQEILDKADSVVCHNGKFDLHTLSMIGIDVDRVWSKMEDTLIAGHLLASNQPHNLTDMAMHYLGVDIQPLEDALQKAVMKCRSMVQQARLKVKRTKSKRKLSPMVPPWMREIQDSDPEHWGESSTNPDWWEPAGVPITSSQEEERERGDIGSWRIAEKGLEGMPSTKEKAWKLDSWLPKAMFDLGLCQDVSWGTVLQEYANADSAVTLALWKELESELRRRGHWHLYKERMRLPEIAAKMEQEGVTCNLDRQQELVVRYTQESGELEERMLQIAEQMGVSDLKLPSGGRNKQIEEFLFKTLNLPTVRWTDSGNPSMDKESLAQWIVTLPKGPGLDFVKALVTKRSRDTALSYLEGYKRFWLPMTEVQTKLAEEKLLNGETTNGFAWQKPQWFVLHPNLNITGTDTLRWSSSNPNSQNISKQEREDMTSLRHVFGPAPGREWWSCDAKNIELRLPFYRAGEESLIELFERPDDPPYYGSNHLLVAHILHPKLFEECIGEDRLLDGRLLKGQLDGRLFKKRYADSWYQWVKNGNFAIQYGCQERKADATYRVDGAFRQIKQRFSKLEALTQKCIRQAERLGYVETFPDKSVDPDHGYPLLCTRTSSGKVLPTVPLSYCIQGTAMWFTARAMVRCQEQLDEWYGHDKFDGRIVLQVHDELVFDLPKRGDPVTEAKMRGGKGPLFRTAKSSNLWRIRVLQRLMEQGGTDLGVPIPVGAEYHAETWAKGVSL